MRGGASVWLYLLLLCTLGVTVRVWWGMRRFEEVLNADELRRVRQELRELRSEVEEVNRVTLKQQATLYKIEAMLDLQGERRGEQVTSGAALSTSADVAAAGAEGGVASVPPPPPVLDDQAIEAFVRTQGVHGAEAEREGEGGGSEVTTTVREVITRDEGGRQTVVFKRKRESRERTGQIDGPVVRTEGEATHREPAVPGGLTLEDLAALVSTVSVHGATGDAGFAQAFGQAGVTTVGSRAESTIERADPSLPGAEPVESVIASEARGGEVPVSTAEPEVARAAQADADGGKASGPRRVTTVPALTGEERPEVPPMRPSRVVRERRGHEVDVRSSLLLSEQFVPARERPARVTISDILAADERE